MLPYYCINGQLVAAAEARLHVSDLSILRGYGVFDYFAVRQGHPMFFADYAARFMRSARLLELDLPHTAAELEALVYELIAANGQPDGGIRLLLTGGYSMDGYTPAQPNFLLMQYPAPQYPTAHFTEGISLLTHCFQRELPAVKSINYLTGIRMQPALRARGAQDVLYYDAQGYVRESDRSNFFMISAEGVLTTPGEKILEGVTRLQLLRLAASLGMRVDVREIHLDELATAQEAFLTSSTKGVMPVTQIDGKPVSNGRVGAGSQQLGAWFTTHAAAYLAELAPTT